MDFPERPPRPLTQKAAEQQLDECWVVIESFRTLHEENQQLKQAVADLTQRLDTLVEQLGSSSRNSSKAPSTDSPEQKAKRPGKRKKSARQPGGQPGHPRHERASLPEDQVDHIEQYFPHERCGCGSRVEMADAPAYRHQIWDIIPMKMKVEEHQFYQGVCAGCGKTHHGQWPDWLPSGQMGAGLISWIGMMSGQYHLSVRNIQSLLKEMCQDTFSTGAISNAQGKLSDWMEKPYQQVGDYVRQQRVAHADETRHSHKHSKSPYWMWTLVSGLFCFFMTHYSRGQEVASQLLGDFSGYLVTDHYSGYNRYPAEKRQICWAHLIRHFRKISARPGQAGAIGNRLLLLGWIIFRTRHHFENNSEWEAIYRRRMQRLRRSFQATLEKGVQLSPVTAKRTRNQCIHLQKYEAMCWTFLKDNRIPLTNNPAESALRPYVIWRKLSFATQSLQGLRFRPMILTLTGTAKQLGMSSWEMLREISQQGLERKAITFQFPFDRRLP